MAQNKHKVVIVGAGYGGLKAALELSKDPRFQVTLINEHPHFRVYGALYKTATGGSRKISTIPLSELLAGKPVRVIQDRAVKLDRKAQIIKTAVGHTVEYEALILGLGMVTNYFGIKGLKEYSFGIKNIDEAEELKRHLHQQLLNDKSPDLNYVVVGGGPTGVELAGELPGYIRSIAKKHGLGRRKVHVDLVEAAPRLLPRMPKDVSRRVARHLRKLGIHIYLRTPVQAQTADALMVRDKPIRSHTVIWTAGMTNNPFFSENKFQLTRQGKVRVDHFLQAEPGIYVVGDNADTPYSGMAQTALYDGTYVARNLIRLANQEDPEPYVAKKPIYVMPAGPQWAAVLWGKVRLYGKAGWVLRRLADFMGYSDYEPWPSALARTLAEDDSEEFCSVCTDDNQRLRYLSGEA